MPPMVLYGSSLVCLLGSIIYAKVYLYKRHLYVLESELLYIFTSSKFGYLWDVQSVDPDWLLLFIRWNSVLLLLLLTWMRVRLGRRGLGPGPCAGSRGGGDAMAAVPQRCSEPAMKRRVREGLA